MRIVHSLLHPDDLADLIGKEYDFDQALPIDVRLLARGFNDSYLVTDSGGRRHVLRVYVKDKYWIRAETDLLFELELLDHLAKAGLPVSRPSPRRSGELLGSVWAPEGERRFALLGYAPGFAAHDVQLPPERLTELGAQIARMHLAMDEFDSSHDRYHLDLELLLDMPLTALEPYMGADDESRYTELREFAERLRAYVSGLDLPSSAYGLIHADLHRGNIHVAPTGELVCFDFDHCGYGWRGYDLATFFCPVDAPEAERRNWSAVLEGYERVRPMDDVERNALPVFAACRAYWNIGDWTLAVDRNGIANVDYRLCDRILREARERLSGADW